MWFIFDDSLADVDPNDEASRSALEQLLYAVAQGQHAIAASPAVGRRLLKASLSPRPHAVLRRVVESAPDLLARARNSLYRIRVASGDGMPSRVGANEWQLPLHWFNLNGVPSSAVIGENLRDVELYRASAEHYNIVRKTGGNISFDHVNGGGADTPYVLESEVSHRRRFILCITDSDKCCPSAMLNFTSRECTRITSNSQWVAVHIALEEREIENLVPLHLLEDTVQALNSSDLQSRIATLVRVAETSGGAWSFVDLKEGTKFRKILGHCPAYWHPFSSRAEWSNTLRSECVTASKCAAASSAECHCALVPALGERIAEHVTNYLKKHSTHATAKRAASSPNAERWLEIGSLLGAWGAAMPKFRS